MRRAGCCASICARRAQRKVDPDAERNAKRSADVRRQIDEYAKGKRQDFEFELAAGRTGLQQAGLERAVEIPFGTTTTYGALAKSIGYPNAARAVGVANGANPIGLIVPCHRVIGSDGSLTGFGGGLPLKRKLLEHEARVAGTRFDLFS